MASNSQEIKIINVSIFKLKILKTVCLFLNWATISKNKRNKHEIVINVKFEIE